LKSEGSPKEGTWTLLSIKEIRFPLQTQELTPGTKASLSLVGFEMAKKALMESRLKGRESKDKGATVFSVRRLGILRGLLRKCGRNIRDKYLQETTPGPHPLKARVNLRSERGKRTRAGGRVTKEKSTPVNEKGTVDLSKSRRNAVTLPR